MDSLPPWSVVQSMLVSVVVPGFVAGSGLLALACAITHTRRGQRIGLAVALVGGVAAGNLTRALLPWWALEPGWPSLFPATSTCVLGLALLEAFAGEARWRRPVGIALAAACAWWLAPAGALGPRLGCFLLLLAGGALEWPAGGAQAGRAFGKLTLALAVIWGLAGATVLIHAHSARFFDLAVLHTVTVAGMGVVTTLRKLDLTPMSLGSCLLLPALMLGGATSTFSDVPLASFNLIAVVPCLVWGLRLWPAGGSDRWRCIGTAVAVLVPCALAVFLAMRAETISFTE